jgi:putative transposase
MNIEHRKKLRHFNLPGHAHDLTFSCYRRLPLLSRDRTRQWLMDAIESARNKQEYAVLAFVIMPEHVHIIVYPFKQQYDIACFLKSIKQSVSRKAHTWLVNHDRQWLEKLTVSGHGNFRFWQAGGGYDRNIDSRSTLLRIIDYIHQNPVRRGLAEKAMDFPWSSASWYEGKECVLAMDSIP